MTPLAKHILMAAHSPNQSLHAALGQSHCFEVSAIAETAWLMAWDAAYGRVKLSSEDLFLPSEPCFIEFRLPPEISPNINREHFGGKARIGWHLWRDGDQINGLQFLGAKGHKICHLGELHIFRELKCGPLFSATDLASCAPLSNDGKHCEKRIDLQARALLAIVIGLINTPKIVGRRQHMPHRGLEKRLLRSRSVSGKFPLRAWTEILLEITPTRDTSAEPPKEAHLTGSRAMHFCRAHLRVKRGKVEVVRGHWRGDPSLGIKRSRYIVSQREETLSTETGAQA
ncbi:MULTISPECIES: hypothetical protein [unclassified Roseibium]|uniref:hypothetical protein n=1 Tax=unclassified Roseibium TaxID=2629323 RepID=UPI00274015F4|nr:MULTISPECIES: hypothetical protein [unclassified Roseibium]